VSEEVITIDDKNRIKQFGNTPEDKAEYLLDNHVNRPLSAGLTDEFVKLLKVMRKIPDCNPLGVELSSSLKSDHEASMMMKSPFNMNTTKVVDETSGIGICICTEHRPVSVVVRC